MCLILTSGLGHRTKTVVSAWTESDIAVTQFCAWLTKEVSAEVTPGRVRSAMVTL